MARLLTIAIIVVAGLYSAYWFVGSSAQERALGVWIEERRADGWVADFSDLSVRGYPSRFDTRITDLQLADPRSGWAWAAPVFQVLALSYQPNHVIAVWPPEQVISSPQERITVTAGDMRASVRFEPNSGLALSAVTLDVEDLALSSSADWSSAMAKAQLATRQTAGTAFAHDVFFQATDMRPARVLELILSEDSPLPEVFEAVKLDATVGFDAPWDRRAIEGRKPELTSLNLREMSARWGAMEFEATGQLTIDRAGVPTGRIAVRAQNWRDMLALAVAADLVPERIAGAVESGLSLIAQFSGNPETIDAPLRFDRGTVALGPIPLGPAPRFVINP
ncbi:MAG: DUF2125 domain-containing protein [Pseudomonadota bacterium]